MTRISRFSAMAAACGALLALGCSEESLVLPGAGTPSRVVAVAGDNQAARVGELLPAALVVEVRDSDGIPVPGVRVRWTAEGGGTVSSSETTTDAAGQATVQRRLGSEPGIQRTIALLVIDEALRETFTASAVPPGSPRLALVTEPPATAVAGAPLSQAPVVQLRTEDGAPLAEGGVSITVAIASGGGELNGTRTRATDDEGRATFDGLTIEGAAGDRRLIFAAEGIASVTSRVIAVSAAPPPPSPGSILIERGDGQTAETGDPVPTDPAVKVLDGSGNPKSGVTVTFTVQSGGGSVSGASAVSDANGIAAVGEWRLGSSPGTNTLRAAASGYEGSPVTFTATAVAPPPTPVATRLAFASQPQDAEEDESLGVILVQILDQNGNLLVTATNRVKIELVRIDGGGELRGSRERDAVAGVAVFDNLRVNKRGEYLLRATAGGLQSAESDRFTIEDD